MQQLAFAWLATATFALSLGYFLYAYLFTFGVAPQPNPAGRPILVNVALFTVFAVHHSLFARTRLKQAVAALLPPAVERATYSLIASILFLLVCAFWQPVPGTLYALPGPFRWLGSAVQTAGVILTIVASRALDVLDLSGVRQVLAAQSAGLPRQQALETGGVYAVVRHPLYLGWALFVFGAPDMTMTRFTFAAVSTAYLIAAIPLEERSLVQIFGVDYQAYERKVRWRMVPFLY